MTLCFLAAAGLMLLGSGQRSGSAPILISFHLETNGDDWPKYAEAIKMGSPAKQYYFRKMPVATDQEIVWFYPFLAEDGATYGAAFKFNQHGTELLSQVSGTPTNQGKLLAVNLQPISSKQGPVRSYIQIDRTVNDGIVVIWKDLTDEHLRVFAQRFPHVRDVMDAQARQ